MKTRFCVLGILLLLLLFKNSDCQSPTVPNICIGKNPLLLKLKQNKVALYKSPMFSEKVCKTEWSAHQSCCDSRSTQEFIKTRIKIKSNKMKAIFKELVELDSQMKKFAEVGLQGVVLPGDYRNNHKKISTLEEIDQLFSRKKLPYLKAAALELIKLLASWQKVMLVQKYRCMKKLDQIFTAGTCSICSGRSEQFFQGGRIKMAEQTCRSILSECGSTWHRMLTVLEITHKYTTIIKLVTPNESKLKESFTRSIKAFADSVQLQKHFASCKTYETCHFESVRTICEQFVTIVEQNVLEKAVVETDGSLQDQDSKNLPLLEEAQYLFEFVATATSSIIAEVAETKTLSVKNPNPFFKQVMSFDKLVGYLRKMRTTLLKTSDKLQQMSNLQTNRLKTSQGISINTCNSLITKLNESIEKLEIHRKAYKRYLKNQRRKEKAKKQQRAQEAADRENRKESDTSPTMKEVCSGPNRKSKKQDSWRVGTSHSQKSQRQQKEEKREKNPHKKPDREESKKEKNKKREQGRKLSMIFSGQEFNFQHEIQVIRDGDPTLVAPFVSPFDA